MNNITLSICIATFNRAAFIGATLDSIISQATEDMEIVIVDGASGDDTVHVVGRYMRLFPRLRYIRQESNQGVDRDFNKAVESAHGKYCWLMSDDDLLKPGAIRSVLNEADNDFGLIIVNAEVRNADLSELIEDSRLHISTNRIYSPCDGERMFVDTASYLSFIGCVVIKRELWTSRERATYFGTVFIHVGVIFQAPLLEETLVIAEPLIIIRYGNALWTARGFEIWMFKWPDLIWSFPDYSASAKRQVCLREPWRTWKELLVYRAKGAYGIPEYRKFLKSRLDSIWSRIPAILIAITPGCIVNLLGMAYLSIFPTQSRLFIMEDLTKSRFYYRSCFR